MQTHHVHKHKQLLTFVFLLKIFEGQRRTHVQLPSENNEMRSLPISVPEYLLFLATISKFLLANVNRCDYVKLNPTPMVEGRPGFVGALQCEWKKPVQWIPGQPFIRIHL